MISLSKDRVKPSPNPDAWFLVTIFIAGLVYGLYLTLSSWTLFYIASHTDFFAGGSALNMVSLEYNSAESYCNTTATVGSGGIPLKTWTSGASTYTTPGSACLLYPELSTDSNSAIYCSATTGISALQQCTAEVSWSRQSMLRSLIYAQVSDILQKHLFSNTEVWRRGIIGKHNLCYILQKYVFSNSEIWHRDIIGTHILLCGTHHISNTGAYSLSGS